MANSDPVQVTVEIIDKFSDDLERLERRLDKIDGKRVDVRLDIDDGRLEEIEARLKKLEENINTTLKINVRGYGAAKAKKEDLEKDMYSTLHIGVDKDRLRGLGNLSGGERFGPPGEITSAEITRPDLDNIPVSFDEQELVDLGFDLDPDVEKNILAAEGATADFSMRERRFTPEEREFINEWIINPDVARAHNTGIPKDKRDGWIGPDTWNFGIGERWGPEPRYRGDKKAPGPGTDFLRGVRELTDSWSDLKIGDDLGDVDLGLDPGIRDKSRTAAETDFLRAINRGTRASRKQIRAGSILPENTPMVDLRRLKSPAGPTPYWELPLRERAQFRLGRGISRGVGRARGAAGRAYRFLDSPDDTPMYQSHFSGIAKFVKKIAPTDMKKWYTILAMLLPILIALMGAAVGLVAAFGALATAGLALTGIGLLGWGDDAAESIRNVKRRLGELKKELGGAIRPVAVAFQPFTAQLFDQLPGMVQKFIDPLMGLVETGYDDWWLNSIEGVAGWFADLLDQANRLAPQIQAIGTAFGQAFGSWLIDFLTRMTLELHDNWDMWVRLTRSFLAIIHLIYELSKVVAFLVALLEPFFILIGKLSDVVGNNFLVALIAAIAAMWALDLALTAVAAKAGYATFAAMASGIWQAVTATGGLTGVMGLLSGVLDTILAKLAAMNLLTGGLLALTGLVVGGAAYFALKNSGTATDAVGGNVPASTMGGRSPGGYGGTQINIYGDVRNREYQKLKDEFPTLYDQQRRREEATNK